MAKGALVSGDAGSVLRVHLTDSETDEAVDLTGKTVKLRYRINGGTVIEKDMTLLDQTNQKGWAQYQFAPADLPTAGDLEGETRLDPGGPGQLTSDETFHIPIRAALA